jgi:hypothetical protein
MIDPDRFWRLLPQFHQRRDVETNGPLRALLEVLAEQAALIDADMDRQYDNWFIETCEDWLVPYIGDLIGYTPVRDTGDLDASLKLEDEALRRVVAPRREVANTIRYRRRKGTLELLEQLAADVAGWSARAVEFHRRVAMTQHMRLPRPAEVGIASVRRVRTSEIGGPDDTMPRAAEVRRVTIARGGARYGPHQVGLFVARLSAVPVTRVTAACAESVGPHCFLSNPLGLDVPLYRPGDPASGILPGPLMRLALSAPRTDRQGEAVHADPDVFGEGRSVMVWVRRTPTAEPQPLAAQQVVPADLRRWEHRPEPGSVALDPERGRLMFPEREAPDQVVVSYHEGALGAVGASERPRRISARTKERTYFPVGGDGDGEAHNTLRDAIEAWRGQQPTDALIEIRDGRTYDEQRLSLVLRENQRLEIRAAQAKRPLLRVVDYEASRDDAWRISGTRSSALVMDGLLIASRRLHVRGDLGSLLLRHCTLVPAWGTPPENAGQPAASSLMMADASTNVRIQHSIVGSIHVRDNELENEPLSLEITDSVVDGGGGDAILGPGSIAAHLVLTIRRSTVIGRSAVHEVSLAENCLFTRRILVARRQLGCMRFCYLPPRSRTPRRFECVPKAVLGGGEATLVPVFVSLRHGQPGYCQLSRDCPPDIWRGASDQGELGVFHNLFLPQREANLRARLAEYVPAATDVDVIYTT